MRTEYIIVPVYMFMVMVSPAQIAQGWKASRETEDRRTKEQPEFNFYESKVPAYDLPGVFSTSAAGDNPTAERWNNHIRPQLLEIFRYHVFGRVPATEYKTRFTVTNRDKNAMDGKATLKQIDIDILARGQSLTIHLTLFTPNNLSGRVPVFLLINNRSSEIADPERKTKSEFWPAEEAIARGYGIAAFRNADVDPDKFDGFKDGMHPLLDAGQPRSGDSWGTLAAWAWGASRCLDYLVTDKVVDGKRVAVVGHSRGGKTALLAGAEDQRFGMVIANESGCGGAAIARRKLGETVAGINESFPHWFCLNYREFNNNEESMPFDMHMLLALTAPRPLYIAAAAEDLWGDPKGCYLALYHSLPAYRLFNKGTTLPPEVPDLNMQVIIRNTGFHIRGGEHDLTLHDWNFFMDFADRVWK